MYLYITPNEALSRTRIPRRLLIQATELPGLERTTGADWFITPLKWTAPKCDRSMPGTIRLKSHIKAGAILVQRKSGGDFLQSIPDLKDFQARMNEWAYADNVLRPGRVWLLVTDIQSRVINGQAVVIAGEDTEHVHSLPAVEGAIARWKLRGGNVEILSDDNDMVNWFDRICQSMTNCIENPVREFGHYQPMQRLVKEPENWVTTGRAFPAGIGRKKLESLARELGSNDPVHNPPTLFKVIECLTAGRIIDAKGWGKTLKARMLEWWGLPTNGSRYVRDLPRFKAITIRFEQPLPFEVNGTGIEQIDDVTYHFSNYESMDAVAMMLCAVQGELA